MLYLTLLQNYQFLLLQITIVYNVWHYCFIIFPSLFCPSLFCHCHKWKNKSLQGIVQCAMTMFLLFHDFFTSLSSIITSLLQRRPFLTTIIFFRPPNLNMVFFSTLGSDAMFLIRKGHTHNQFLVSVFHIFFSFLQILTYFSKTCTTCCLFLCWLGNVPAALFGCLHVLSSLSFQSLMIA